uniref:Uncharacterized protein n=1 Tax=Glossina austeni TaxID=7395 RepID=A0A1A9UWR1_GLOAU
MNKNRLKKYALSPELYQRSFIYCFWHMWPIFLIFRMRTYTGLCLSECVCNMGGFGAYPEQSDATNGAGPRKLMVENDVRRAVELNSRLVPHVVYFIECHFRSFFESPSAQDDGNQFK